MAYPENTYQRGSDLLKSIGSYWYTIFGDADKLHHYYSGYAIEGGQAYRTYLESLAAVSRFDIPVFHRDNWYLLVIKESEFGQELLKYGDTATYGESYSYGIRYAAGLYSAPAPENMVNAKFLFNRIVDPSITLTAGIDYRFEDGTIRFKDNPFNNSLVPKREVISETTGEVIDREIGLWAYFAEFDLQYVWEHFGYVLGIYMESSEHYKAFVNSMLDCYACGPTLFAIQNMLAAVSGISIVIEPEEKVEVIIEQDTRKQVITDHSVYTFPPNINLTVNVGDTIYGGTTMCDTISIYELRSEIPGSNELPALAFGGDFMNGGYIGELIFENKTVNLEYFGVDDDNKAIVRFEVSGMEEDVESFWEQVHAAGKAGGSVLADYLDTRINKVGPPLPSNLPATVNPLTFVLENILRNNLFIIKLKPDFFAEDAPGAKYLRFLRKIIPPHTTFIVYIETVATTEDFPLGSGPTVETPGLEEFAENFMAPVPPLDIIEPYEDLSVLTDPYVRELPLRVFTVDAACDSE